MKTDVFVLPDCHVPHHHKQAFRSALALLGRMRPEYGVIIGDFGDFESVSHHPRNRPELSKLALEYRQVNGALDAVLDASPLTRWFYIEGNHEYRVVKHTVNVVPHLDGLLDVPASLDLKKRNVTWIPFRNTLRRAWISPWGVGYMHSLDSNGKVRPGKYHAAAHARLVGPLSRCPLVVYGHHHTFQHYRSAAGFEASCCGFLGDYDSDDTAFDYNSGPTPWTLGVLHQIVNGKTTITSQIPL